MFVDVGCVMSCTCISCLAAKKCILSTDHPQYHTHTMSCSTIAPQCSCQAHQDAPTEPLNHQHPAAHGSLLLIPLWGTCQAPSHLSTHTRCRASSCIKPLKGGP